MPEEYHIAVLAYYNEQKDKADFPQLLRNPTTARIKRLCLKIYDSARYDPKDNDILSEFFNVDKIDTNFREILSGVRVGVFRALLNHINEETTTTNERNADLLAWLIDFQPRPSFVYYRHLRDGTFSAERTSEGNSGQATDVIIENDQPPNTNLEDNGDNKEGTSTQETGTPESDLGEVGNDGRDIGNSDDEIKSPFPIKKSIIVGVIAILVAGGSTLFWKGYNIQIAKINDPNAKCMYWNDDHYERIACNETADGASVIKKDEKKLANFKRIMIPDTLTKCALGKVWYTKINGKHQFFTDSGTHPVDTLRGLSPLTPYILYRYISYQRYLLIRLIWSFGGIMLFVFAGLSIRYFRRKAIVKTIDAKVNTESFTPVC